MWQIWIILAGIFVIFEMIIPTDFLIFWVGIGAIIAAIVSLFVDNLTAQIAVFVISSTLLIIFTKPLTKKFVKTAEDIQTNAYSTIGKEGLVISEIDPITGQGQVKVNSEIWSAKSSNSQKITKDTIITVTAIEGVKAVVKPKEDTNN